MRFIGNKNLVIKSICIIIVMKPTWLKYLFAMFDGLSSADPPLHTVHFFSYLRFLWVCESSRGRPVHRHMAWITWRNVLVFFNTYKHRISRTHIRNCAYNDQGTEFLTGLHDFISCLLLSFVAAIVDERHHWTCDGANTCATLNNRPPVWSRLPWHLSS